MKKTLIILWFAAISSAAFAQEKRAVHWLTFKQLSDSLTVRPKPVLLFFHTDWCAYCRKMLADVFTNPAIAEKLNDDYYAVQFDAESIDTVYFDGQILRNEHGRKQTGKYHDIAKILAARNGDFAFPTTLLLQPDFRVQRRYFEYIGPQKLLKALRDVE